MPHINYFCSLGQYWIEFPDDRPNERIDRQSVVDHWKNGTADMAYHTWSSAVKGFGK